jgi:hypothetical protein
MTNDLEQKKFSLWQLQDMAQQAEETINSADEITLAAIMGEVADKVDNIKYMIDTLESEAVRFKTYKDQMAARESALKKAAQRLKEYTIASLKAHGTQFELGNLWTAKITTSERVDMLSEAPTDTDYINLALKYPVIRKKLEWDKTEIKKLLKDGNNDLLPYARIVQSDNLNFKPINVSKK